MYLYNKKINTTSFLLSQKIVPKNSVINEHVLATLFLSVRKILYREAAGGRVLRLKFVISSHFLLSCIPTPKSSYRSKGNFKTENLIWINMTLLMPHIASYQ